MLKITISARVHSSAAQKNPQELRLRASQVSDRLGHTRQGSSNSPCAFDGSSTAHIRQLGHRAVPGDSNPEVEVRLQPQGRLVLPNAVVFTKLRWRRRISDISELKLW